MTNRDIEVHDIIQITENGQEGWIGALLVVSEVNTWGVLAYTKIPTQGDAYLRVPFDQFELVGRALLVHPDDQEIDDAKEA